MPMRYANEADVLAQLRLTPASDEYERLVRLENGLCDVFDHKTGTSFGTAPVAETRTVLDRSTGPWHWFGIPPRYMLGTVDTHNRLILSTPLRSLTGIETGGTWDGAAWVDGTALTADEYRLTNATEQGSYAIDLMAGVWGGVVRITGIWGDQVTASVPDDVREAVNILLVKQARRANSSESDVMGPDGMPVPTPHGWSDPLVKSAIDRHTVVQVLV